MGCCLLQFYLIFLSFNISNVVENVLVCMISDPLCPTPPGAYAGGCTGCTCTPPLTWEKSFAQKCPKQGEKVPPAKKNVHIPFRYDKIKTKKGREKMKKIVKGKG